MTELEQARDDIDNFSELIKTKGWLRLMEIASKQLEHRTADLIGGDTLPLEEMRRMQGAINGIRLFMKMPDMAIEYARETLTQHTNEGEGDED